MLHQRECRTVLDIVKSKLIELRSWNIDDESVYCEIRGTPEEAEQRAGKQNADIDPTKIRSVESGRQALLAACRDGNIALVKDLTLSSWGFDQEFPPIAISDVSGYSQGPFLLAVENKHYDLARTIVRIATIQHIDFANNHPSDLYNELADDNHSADSIMKASSQVNSTVTAKKIVADSHSCFAGEKRKDMDMLRFSIEMESSFPREQSDIERQTRHAWALVEHGDWPEAFEEYIKATGAPFRHVTVEVIRFFTLYVLLLAHITLIVIFAQLAYEALTQVASSSMDHLVRPVIEKAPHVMFYEDIHGKTPFDHLVEKQLHGFIEHLMPSYTRNRKWQASSPLVHWPLFAFAPDYAGPTYPRDPYQAWEISRELAASWQSHRFTRKLVTNQQRDEIAVMLKNKKIQKNPKGDQHDVISLSVYKPGNLCCSIMETTTVTLYENNGKAET
ncbi:hypothetical protein MKX07_004390 [Trichoderma sp. CBMAI-0711]|nr:hypothetical protein MKX07_004390 [Trichoderma sp. CBMAI-0711]